MKRITLGRLAVAAGMLAATTATVVVTSTPALADVENPPRGTVQGGLHLSPASGDGSEVPNYSTTGPCPAGFQGAAEVFIIANDHVPYSALLTSPNPNDIVKPGGFSGQLGFPMSLIQTFNETGDPETGTFEMVVQCRASLTSFVWVQSTFVTFQADGHWSASDTPPVVAGASATSLSSNFTDVPEGTSITFTATVTPPEATGNVEFRDELNTLLATEPLAFGSASAPISSLHAGDHTITAHYVGDAAHNGSTSSPLTVHIGAAGTSGSETINVNVPLSQGVFTLTVSGTPVQLTEAANNGTEFVSTGVLSDVTVNDQRLQTQDGWSVSGRVSDFHDGTNTISGSKLGWSPNVKAQNPASDVVAGPDVPAGTSPGLFGGSQLAGAAAQNGVGQSVLSADLELRVPLTTKVGNYSALLTLTAITHA